MSINISHRLAEKQRLILVVVIAWFINACNLPGQSSPTQSSDSILATQVAENIAVGLTQVAQETMSPEPATPGQRTEAATPTTTGTPAPTVTQTSPPATNTPAPCDQVEFVKDVTYPDNTEVPPGEIFVKTWRLLNAGTCTWTPDYALVFTGGDPMGAPASIQLPGYVNSGQTIDISVTLRAPDGIGTYRGDFKLRNPSNVIFGIGVDGKPFYVQIKISAATGLLFDFITQASSADWTSGMGGAPDTTLTFNGADDDAKGVAKLKDGIKLENGSTSDKVLLTYPKHESDGFISGTYSSYTVQNGDHFKARLGFLLAENSCGVGKVKFRLNFLEAGSLNTMQDWVKTCNGNLINVDLDLSSLKGRTVQFMLAVLASGDSNGDWAVWISPRIEHP